MDCFIYNAQVAGSVGKYVNRLTKICKRVSQFNRLTYFPTEPPTCALHTR